MLSKNMPVLQVGVDMDGSPLKEKGKLINYYPDLCNTPDLIFD